MEQKMKQKKSFKQLFYKLRYKDEPVPTNADCEECNWTGKPSDCETGWEDGDLENPGYPIAFCPKCKEPSVVWYNKEGDKNTENKMTS
jgi:hypothetical protein